MKKEKYQKLKKIKQSVIKCRKCQLYLKAKYPVIGQGSHDAKILFVGEAPGRNEDETGIPFCGVAGQILDELLINIGIRRKNVYICNIIKHRPPGNRDPRPEEIEACKNYIIKQIDIINPRIICGLGRFSTYFLMQQYGLEKNIQSISKIHGKIFSAGAEHGQIIILPLFHPAVATYNINMKKVLQKDIQILTNYL